MTTQGGIPQDGLISHSEYLINFHHDSSTGKAFGTGQKRFHVSFVEKLNKLMVDHKPILVQLGSWLCLGWIRWISFNAIQDLNHFNCHFGYLEFITAQE